MDGFLLRELGSADAGRGGRSALDWVPSTRTDDSFWDVVMLGSFDSGLEDVSCRSSGTGGLGSLFTGVLRSD